MASEKGKFHIFFLPFMAQGHMIPSIQMARLFSTRGLKSTIVTTPLGKPSISQAIEINNQNLDTKIDILTIEFPCQEAGLPQGCESSDRVPSPALQINFCKAITLFQIPFENLLKEFNPNCIIVDSSFPWASSTAQKFRIPCLSFHGCSYFSQCVISNLLNYKPYKNVLLDNEEFIVPDLPHDIKLTKAVLSPMEKEECPSWLTELSNQLRESEKACDGVIMNSFYELESDYIDYYENSLKRKHWHIGPLSLYSNENNNVEKGKKYCIDVSECMKWLDEKEVNSVIYVCFGSLTSMSNAQLHELALALEYSDRNFILVVKKGTKEWMPDGFEARIKDKGLIIIGWAPQGKILRHEAVGGFITHCGWNSVLEAVTVGVPMVTWPCHGEQFHNEKLITNVIKIGVPVGIKKWVVGQDDEAIVKKEDIAKAVTVLMASKEGQEMKERAECLKDSAKRAIEVGGSSYSSIDKLIEELISFKM